MFIELNKEIVAQIIEQLVEDTGMLLNLEEETKMAIKLSDERINRKGE